MLKNKWNVLYILVRNHNEHWKAWMYSNNNTFSTIIKQTHNSFPWPRIQEENLFTQLCCMHQLLSMLLSYLKSITIFIWRLWHLYKPWFNIARKGWQIGIHITESSQISELFMLCMVIITYNVSFQSKSINDMYIYIQFSMHAASRI